MEIQTLTSFFMWCTIINFRVLLFRVMVYMLAPDLAYRLQSKSVPNARETFNIVFYSFIGFFKAIVVVFFVVPWIALLTIR